MLKAPAGYGKTTLAVEWSHTLLADGWHTAWLRADFESDEPNLFLFYLATAIEQACAGVGRAALDLIAEREMPPPHALIAALVNALAAQSADVCLFIDDFHLIESAQSRQAFLFLLQHAPASFHVVLTTREEPRLSLGTMYARGEVCEVDAAEFRFSIEETARLFQNEAVAGLSESNIHALQRDTGGWVAALRIALSSLRAGVAADECLRHESGAGYALETFLDELMLRLPPHYFQFMLRSSILPSLSAEVCNELVGIRDSALLLDELFHQYQLINQESGDTGAYGYHPLVRDFLLLRLMRTISVDELHALHLKAAHWYAHRGLTTEAIRHAVNADARELVAQWTEQSAMRLLKEGNIRVVLGWRKWLPKDWMRWQLSLRLVIGWSLLLAAQREAARAWLYETEADMAAGMVDSTEQGRVECLAMRVCLEATSDATELALRLSEQYNASPLPDPWIKNAVNNCVMYSHLVARRHDLVDQIPWVASLDRSGLRAIPSEVYRLCEHGLSYAQRYRLNDAETCFRKAQHLAHEQRGPQSSLAAIPAVLLAQQWYACDRMAEAQTLLENRLEPISVTGFLDCQLLAYVLNVRLALWLGDFVFAHQLLDQADVVAKTEGWLRMSSALTLERLRICLEQGNVSQARACLDALTQLLLQCGADDGVVLTHVQHNLQQARAWWDLHTQRVQDVVSTLEPIWQFAIDRQSLDLATRIGTLQALALLTQQQESLAWSKFKQVLMFCLPVDVLLPIVDISPHLNGLIELAHRKADSPDLKNFITRLQGVHTRRWHAAPTAMRSEMSCQLTSREHEILTHIANGCSNKVLAKDLGVSPETVKSHLKNIFSKLNVDNRVQAVNKARHQGLLL